jgi:carbonic anhydrase
MLFDVEKSGCKEQDQSPINLSQSTSRKCKRLCDWKVNDRSVRSATVVKSNNSAISLLNFSESITASYNASENDPATYTCSQIDLYNMAQHAIENSYGDLELVATFTSPGKKTIKMGVIIVSSARNTKSPSIAFLNAFVPHASDGNVNVTFDGSWSLQSIVPADIAYFVYEGRDFVTCAEECTWIVYKNPVDIDSSTYARFVGSTVSNRVRKPLQQLSVNGQQHERHVYFSDPKDVNPAYTKKDGKVYMRCRRLPPNTSAAAQSQSGGAKNTETFTVGSSREYFGEEPATPAVQSGGVIAAAAARRNEETAMTASNFAVRASEWFAGIGGVFGILTAGSIIASTCLIAFLWPSVPIRIFWISMWIPEFFHQLVFGVLLAPWFKSSSPA